MNDPETFKRTVWGYWEVLNEGPGYKVKRLSINPKGSISKQYHNFRSETWCIVSGKGQLFLDDKMSVVLTGDVFTIPVRAVHRVLNISETENLVAIEVQLGSITEETDIVRI